ncbi:MAG: hypothetical protein JOZ55_04995 [Alphaproteobacteria bacterium]|nr:hypothetical protein [Alphaproteobacteria bacterium]
MRRLEQPPSAAVFSMAGPAARAREDSSSARRIAILSSLLAHRVPEPLAHALAADAAKLGHGDDSRALAAALEKRMRAMPIDYTRTHAVLLKGMSGAGKTTVSAKIAAQALLTGRRVKLMTCGAPAASVSALAQRLPLKIVTAPSTALIAKAVAEAHRRRSLVVVDTAGFNPRKAKERLAFEALSQVGKVETVAVVSALYDSAEMAEILKALASDRVIVTGLDLARRAGAFVAAASSGTPIAHVARSAFPGDGLEPVTPLALADLLLSTRPA